MKYSTIGYILGQVLKFEGIFMLLPFLTGMIYHENEAYSYLIIGIICFVLGCLITLKKVKHPQIFNREGFVAVALSWIVLSIFGAIPFVITGEIPSYVDALFETPEEYLAAVNYITNVYLTTEIQTDKILLLAGSYHGPSVEAEYEFWVKAPGETEYAKISDYDTRTWVEYPTTVHGSYQFRVNARVVGSDADFERYYECYLDF